MTYNKIRSINKQVYLNMRVVIFGIISAIILVFLSAGTSSADIDNDWEWAGGGVEGSAWGKEPGTGLWSNLPNLGDGPFIYDYELVCFDGEAGYIDCLNNNSCEAAPGGKYVLWKRAVREITPPIWDYFEGNGPACVYSEDPIRLVDEIRGMIRMEFQNQPVNSGRVGSQPGPHTMVGAETNVYVNSEVQVIETKILGQNVKIIATPAEYLIHYGDGTDGVLSYESGVILPAPLVGQQTATSHIYKATGNFQIYATVYFTAEYSLNDGPMIPVDGRGVFNTPAEAISVWKSESSNVADDCLKNPAGFGC